MAGRAAWQAAPHGRPRRMAGRAGRQAAPAWHDGSVPEKSSRSRAFRAAEIAAWTLGVVLIGAYFVIRARHAAGAREGLRRFEEQREQARATGSVAPLAPATGSVAPAIPAPTPAPLAWGEPDRSLWSHERVKAWTLVSSVPEVRSSSGPLAVLKIPKIHLEVPVVEGTDDPALDYGVGHVEGTALPGEAGNVAIAGHRDGFFRGLKDIAVGDAMELETVRGSEPFVVENIWLVTPNDVWVLDPTPKESITLVTCYPFYFVGSAPQRYIVRATRSSAPLN
jgi:LPXTG-site transpeptidase (sortase) family protein